MRSLGSPRRANATDGASIGRAAARILEKDARYTRLLVDQLAGAYVLRAERPIGADVLLLPPPGGQKALTPRAVSPRARSGTLPFPR